MKQSLQAVLAVTVEELVGLRLGSLSASSEETSYEEE